MATVDNPTVRSIEFSSRHELIYVTYHTNGPEILGAIEVYDESDTDNPPLEEENEFENLEFNNIHISSI